MNKMNDKALVKEQYENATGLNTRISIHDKYSVNKQGLGNWIVANYEIEEGMRVLELGCGTGSMWKNHLDIIGKCSEFVITDFSEGMLKEARENIGNLPNVIYQVVDIQEIPFADEVFDVVIANMMLYHVPDLQKGLNEVSRVLKEGGRFYCATGGEHGIMEYVSEILQPYDVDYHAVYNFSLQNGGEKLNGHFSYVARMDYIDALEVTDIDDFVDYIFSGITFKSVCKLSVKEVKEIFVKSMVNGVLRVPKEGGTFVCIK